MSELDIHDPHFGLIEVRYFTTETQEIFEALAELRKEKVVGFDTETYARTPYNDPTKPLLGLYPCLNKLRLVQLGTANRVFIFDMMYADASVRTAIREVLEAEYPIKVAHNANYDVKMGRKHLGVTRFGRVCCTELLSRLVKCGLHTYRISLKNAIHEYLNIEVDKSKQLSDWSQQKLDYEQLRYAARDVVYTLKLREALLPLVKELKIERAVSIDFDTIDPVAAMEIAGFPINKPMWIKTDGEMYEKKWDTIEKLHNLIRRDILPQQSLFAAAPLETKRKNRKTVKSAKVIMEFLEELGIDVPEVRDRKTNKTRKSTGHDALDTIKDQHEMIPLLLEFRELAKRNDSYGADYIEEYTCPECNRIHARYDPQATKTARFSCQSPNLQQIPGIPIYRSCFRPDAAPLWEGSKFVIADYSQIELRAAAKFTGDPGYINAFLSGEDFHSATAKLLVDDPNDADAVKAMRTAAKRINFGIIYGLGALRLAAQLGIPIDKFDAKARWYAGKLKGVMTVAEWEAEGHDEFEPEPWESVATATEYMDKYIARFKVLMAGLNKFGNEAARFKQIRTWTGRLVKFWVDPNDKGSVAQAQRNGKNTPIQGGAGEILKIALRYVFDEIHASGKRVQLVHIVHDEIILEAHPDDAEWAREMLERNMIKAGDIMLEGVVPCKVDAEVVDSWAEK